MILSNYENEEALELIADLIEPITDIVNNEKVKQAKEKKLSNAKIISIAIKNCKKQIIEVLARLNGVKPSEYKGTPITMAKEAIELLNDPEIQSLFFSPAPTAE